ncbi:MAG: mechanosensitive ion channel [bacterium]|nr:mechanosensitive ion channel [bacterium]
MAEITAFETLFNTIKDVFSGILNNLIIAAIILLIGFIAGRLLGKFVHKLLHEIELNKAIRLSTGIKLSLEEIISTFVSYFTYFVSFVLALDQLGVDTLVFNIIAAGVIVVIVLSALLAVKDFIPNVVAGFFIKQKGLIKKGDKIKFGDLEGKIVQIELIETRLETKKKDMIFVPNSAILKGKIVKKH